MWLVGNMTFFIIFAVFDELCLHKLLFWIFIIIYILPIKTVQWTKFSWTGLLQQKMADLLWNFIILYVEWFYSFISLPIRKLIKVTNLVTCQFYLSSTVTQFCILASVTCTSIFCFLLTSCIPTCLLLLLPNTNITCSFTDTSLHTYINITE